MPEPSGVQFAVPPADLLPSISAAIDAAVRAIPPGKRGALVAVANERGANAAVVAKVGGAWEVQAWVGKQWDAGTTYGAALRRVW